MKLNEDEKRFILLWAIDYKNAYHAAKSYCRVSHIVYPDKKTLEDATSDFERLVTEYGHFKFWYGVLFGLLHCPSYNVRNTIYEACRRSLQNITNASYKYEKAK